MKFLPLLLSVHLLSGSNVYSCDCYGGRNCHPEEWFDYKLDEKIIKNISEKNCHFDFVYTGEEQNLDELKKHLLGMGIVIYHKKPDLVKEHVSGFFFDGVEDIDRNKDKYEADISSLVKSCKN